jgi:Tfp pilus assembly protein PilN
MINLLSPAVKEQFMFSRRNRTAIHYLRLTVVVLVTLVVVFISSLYVLDHLVAATTASMDAKEQTINGLSGSLTQAQDASRRLLAIKQVLDSRTKFSVLLDKLAKVLPAGVSLDGISLTGDSSKPVRLSVTGNTYNSILAFRDALAGSDFVTGVDLETINESGGFYKASAVIGFKLGQLK